MNLQDALLQAKLNPELAQAARRRQILRLQRRFNRLYDRYIGEGFYCPPEYYPPAVAEAWKELQSMKGES